MKKPRKKSLSFILAIIVTILTSFGSFMMGRLSQRPIEVVIPNIEVQVPEPIITITPIIDPNIIIDIAQQEKVILIENHIDILDREEERGTIFFIHQNGGIEVLTPEEASTISVQTRDFLQRRGMIR